MILAFTHLAAAMAQQAREQKRIRPDETMELQEDTCTLSSNNTYRRSHTTYEVSDKDKGSAFLDLNFLIKDETSSLKGNLSDDKDVDFYNFSMSSLYAFPVAFTRRAI